MREESIEARLTHLVQYAPANLIAALLTDPEGKVVWVNHGLVRLSGWPEERLTGQPVVGILGLKPATRDYVVLAEALTQGRAFSLKVTAYRRNGRPYWAAIQGIPQPDHGYALLVTDLTAQWRATRQDPLTGLLDRMALQAYFPKVLARAERQGMRVVVGMLDLDNFKTINDRYGHGIGDIVLHTAAQRMREAVRATDLVIRLGGDEFVLVLEDWGDDKALNRILSRLVEAITRPIPLPDGSSASMTASIGLTSIPPDQPQLDELLHHADLAMYASKASKGTRPVSWQWWTSDAQNNLPPQEESVIDPYSPEATALLEQALEQLVEAAGSLEALLAPQRRVVRFPPHLAPRLRTEFQRVLDPKAAQEVPPDELPFGALCALQGVDSPTLTYVWTQWYHGVMNAILFLPWRPDRKMALTQVLTRRVNDAMRRQIQDQTQVARQFQQVVHSLQKLRDRRSLWPDVVQATFRRLMSLPGIVAAVLARPDEAGRFVYEFQTDRFESFLEEYKRLRKRPYPQVTTAHRTHILAKAWTTGNLAVRSDLLHDTSSPTVRTVLEGLDLRSAMAIPVTDESGIPVAILCLYGSVAGMFATPELRTFGTGVANFLSDAWRHHSSPWGADPLPQSDRVYFRRLLFANHLVFEFQPVVSLRTGQWAKVELLARLVDQSRHILPGQFLSALGQNELERLFVQGLNTGIGHQRAWQAEGLHVNVGINLPGVVLLNPASVDWVETALSEHQADPSMVELELLESDPSDLTLQRQAIERLKALGVRIVMDDLGAGYSGLQRLRQLPFHAAKVDWTLVREVTRTPEKTVAFLGALAHLLHDLGLAVVMEGLETPELVELAIELGADYGQGYALGRPMPADALIGWNAERHWRYQPGQPRTELGKLAQSWRQNNEDASNPWQLPSLD